MYSRQSSQSWSHIALLSVFSLFYSAKDMGWSSPPRGKSLLLADASCAIHFPFCWDVSQNHTKPSIPAMAFFWEEDPCWVSGSCELPSGVHPGMGAKSLLHVKAFLKEASHTPLVKQTSVFYLSLGLLKWDWITSGNVGGQIQANIAVDTRIAWASAMPLKWDNPFCVLS